ncbi:autotransporter outer membrane beta-barrel domain-containing protein [Cupriavidus basilensis]|uniref:autotransporter outer membrane beta-barrel domain-containing protein n=1 Tax=Cupriavidus basilensis TaxID=68895 RepID=UPI00284F02A4|nr:autotransporter domain-containing protein [Cupriavidus basilensis]MDR3379968.1 autotransporter domain-containing protein [Cupriavidus basilensis]
MKHHRSSLQQEDVATGIAHAGQPHRKASPPSVPRAITTAAVMAFGSLAFLPATAAAVTGCQFYSPNTISNTLSSTCVLGSGSSLNVTASSGVISVAGGPGVSVGPGVFSPVGTITNFGSISSRGSDGSSGTPASPNGNDGSAGTGISVSSAAPGAPIVNLIANQGTISGVGGNGGGGALVPGPTVIGGAGAAGIGVSVSNAGVATITNNGSIAGTGGNGGPTANFFDLPGRPGMGIGISVSSGTLGSLENNAKATISGIGGNVQSAGAVFATGGAATGVSIESSNVQSIQNAGTISATGGSGRGGTLPGTAVGGGAIGISIAGSTVGTVANTGTLTASSPGGFSTGINVQNSTVDRIDNFGTISAGTAISISADSTITNGIHNAGRLDGAVQLGKATLELDGATATVTGPVYGQAGSVVNVNGTFTSGNTFQVDTFNVANSAQFNMGHDVTVASGLNNAGTLAVAAGKTATIHGNYTQAASGVFQTGLGANGAYGKLVVNGTADLSASNKINVNVAGAPSLVAGTSVQPGVILATKLVAGPTFTVTDNSALFDFIATRNGNAVDLCVARAGATSCSAAPVTPTPDPASPTSPLPAPTPAPVITVVSSVTGAQNTPGLGAARVLDALISQGAGAPAAMAPVITALGTLPTEQAVSDAVKQTLPLMVAGMTDVNSAAMHATNRVIQSRQEANRGLSSGDEFISDRQVWFKPVGSWAKQNDRDGVAGYKANTYGMVLGADTVVSDNARVGGAFSYMHSRIDGNSPVAAQSASVDGYRLISYGSYSLDPRTDISVQADLGAGRNEGQRNINFGGLNSRASSSYNSWNAHVGAGIGRVFNLQPTTTFTPSLRADYTFIQDAAYTETGADALSLAVAKNSARELILSTEARLNQALTEHAMFSANLGVGYDALAQQSAITAAYVGGGAQFVTRGMAPSRWLMRAGLGFVVTSSKAMEVSVRYDAEVRESFTNQTASVKVRLPF